MLSGQRLPDPEPLVTEPIVEWYAGTATALLGALQAVSPDEPVPNFSYVDERAAFWARRQMHEATVHAVDAAQALGIDEDEWGVAPVDRRRRRRRGPAGLLPAHDGPQATPGRTLAGSGSSRPTRSESWLIAPATASTARRCSCIRRSTPTQSVSGTAVELYLALWKRMGPERLDFEGVDGRILFDGPTTP